MRFVAQYTNNLSEEETKYTFNHNTGKLVTGATVYAMKGDGLIIVSPEFMHTENVWGGSNNQVSYYNTVDVYLKSFNGDIGDYQLNIDLEFQN